jgi:F-type H+-transporting ATPase subunit epsilon
VRGGVLTVASGREIAIATREAVLGDDLATLDRKILSRFEADADAERTERVDSTRLQLSAIRQIVSHLQGSRSGIGGFS